MADINESQQSEIVRITNRDESLQVDIDSDAGKNLLRTKSILADLDGAVARVTNFSELRTVERNIDVETKFYYNINTITISSDHQNGGSASVTNRQARLTTGTTANGRAFLRTVETIDYRVSQDIEGSCTFVFPDVTGTAGSQVGPVNCKQVLGLQSENEQNYIRWGFENGSEFFVEYGREGVNTRILASNFNVDVLDGVTVTNNQTSEYAPDFTKLQVVRVLYSWHGVTPFLFQIQKPNGDWRTFHIESFINSVSVSSIGIPVLPLGALCENQNGSTTNRTLIWQAGQISFLGNRNLEASSRSFEVDVNKVVSTEAPIVTIRNKANYQSLANFINLSIKWLSLSSDGNKNVIFRLYRNVSLTGASYSDVNTVNSTVEVDTSATAFSGGIQEIAFNLGKNDSLNREITQLDLELYPNQTFTITGQSASTNDTRVALRWKEEH